MKNTELQEKIDGKRARRLESCPESWRKCLKDSWKTASRRNAVKAFCGECVGFDRSAITTCPAYACPLWNLRPFQDKSKPDESLPASQ